MTTPPLSIDVRVDEAAIRKLVAAFPDRTEAALNRAIDDLLATVELIQIQKYTTTAFPERPPGSTYRRTFRLRSASRTRRTGRSLPNVSGQWFADPGVAPYAAEVLGTEAEQVDTFAGRWKTVEIVAAEAERLAPDVIEEQLQDEFIKI